MARIRTIKPEFWTDDKVVQVSFPARLLFIGLWNFADDSGNLENSPVQIKMRILPADSVSVPPLLQELIGIGLLREYSVNEKNYLNIPGFTLHQVINKPSKTRLPRPPATTPLPDGRERNGREGKGKEVDLEGKRGEGTDPALPSPPFVGGGAAAPEKGNGNGQSVGEEKSDSPTLNFVDSLPKSKRDALLHAVEKFNSRAWSRERVDQHLCASEFEDQELRMSGHLFVGPEGPR